ncbi:vinorine synthase-like [Camellia sinensis]|uniref:vinorine synthase-like n=1 Tax=Camellia sinensis TaxID=4442 RepID=UPI001036048A|nr:vinorine synthase-like [Camellia sinensis]
MEVELISKEIIKPSSSTPPHLRTMRLSLLDQGGGLGHVPIILYYTKRDANFNINEKVINQLKDSLSKTLALFYPLAGRVKDRFSIDCDDEGVLFSTTRVNCDLANLITTQPPDLQSFPALVPYYVFVDPRDKVVQVAIQLNIFTCGGVVISGCFMHKIMDGATIGAFLKSWASNSIATDHSNWPERMLLREGDGIVQRFLFKSEAISTLKAKATSERVPNPTRVEAISGFIWKHAMAASKAVWGMQQPSMLSHQMDLRRKIFEPSLSKYSIGNFTWKVVAHYYPFAEKVEEEEEEKITSLDGLVGLLRAAIEKTRDDILPKLLQGDDGGYDLFSKFVQELRETCQSNKNLNPYTFSSWCKIGFNEVDFGWGKPTWVSPAGAGRVNSIYKNTVVLIEAGLDDRIEAWLTLDEREMAVLEHDQEFLEFAYVNPAVILP